MVVCWFITFPPELSLIIRVVAPDAGAPTDPVNLLMVPGATLIVLIFAGVAGIVGGGFPVVPGCTPLDI